jgi:hypothetical protein
MPSRPAHESATAGPQGYGAGYLAPSQPPFAPRPAGYGVAPATPTAAPVATPSAWNVGAPAVAKPAVVAHAGMAVLAGAAGASNAAADPAQARGPNGEPPPRKIEGDVLQLLWFLPEITPRVRRRPEWKKLLDELEQARFDPEVDEPAAAEDPAELEDRREVFEVLARGKSTDLGGVERAMLDAIRPDGRFAPQLLLVAGELRFDFDEFEHLKAAHSIAASFASGDDELKKALEPSAAYLATPELVPNADVATNLTTRIREAFAKANRPVGPTYLDDQCERTLLERRAFQKRSVFGKPHLRALFHFPDASHGLPTYLPPELGPKLPLFRRLRAKCLVEAHYQADQYEVSDAALKAVALARVVR